ncbi:non-ribosomal peptide synthetase [uncultured Vibrio sp.]|uniref:non-ribosomal peptide synthetase n=1 Tax=uncultured Vibrio sp. TaxID=114054 RepID=UPI00262E64E0|nr:non-ribosomal peptide synthetase [uncultured Vibrio sp.]
MNDPIDKNNLHAKSQSKAPTQPKATNQGQIDKHALAKRFLQLGKPEQIKFIELLSNKGLDFEKLPIVSVGSEQQVSLSPAQQRLWDIYRLDKGNSAYHMSGTFKVNGDLDIDRLTQLVNQVLERHDVLRTRFITSATEQVIQFVDKAAVMHPVGVDAQSWNQEQIQDAEQEFIGKAFELETELPIRMQCLRTGDHSWKLQLVMHHIVSDGWSIGVFLNELVTLYQQGKLPELAIQYRDYSHWQSALLDAGKGQQHIEFWKRELLQTDQSPLFPWHSDVTPNQRRIADSISYELNESQSDKLKQIARQLSVTTSSLWLGIWQAALAKVTYRTDISVGVPMANRTRHEVSNLIGFFVNTMVIQQSITPNSSLSDVIEGAHNKVLEAQEHQLLPFDQLVSAFTAEQNDGEPKNYERKAGQTPLFQVLFNHQSSLADEIQLDSQLTLKAEQQNGEFALFDIALDIRETERKIGVVLTYSKDRIDSDAMVELNSVLEHLIGSLESHVDNNLARINHLTRHDASVLEKLSQPEGEWEFQSIVELIGVQAKARPDAIALKHQDFELSYVQLDSASSELASKLVAKGVVRDQAIGVLFERGVEMIVSMVAVMKAGGAFLPLDPDYPTERLAYMVQDSKAGFVITQQGLELRWQNIQSEFDVSLPKVSSFVYRQQDLTQSLDNGQCLPTELMPTILPEQLAYIIYTSGSTGKPKGVAVNHNGLSMHVQTIGKQYGMTPEDVELHFASISFDGAVERWTVPLAFGSKLVIRDQELWSAEKTCEVLCNEKITIACFPPSYVGPLLDWIEYQKPSINVRSWTLGGEAFTAETYQRLQKVVNPPRIINGYGPTETVVTPMIWRAYPQDKLDSAYAPIGHPVGERCLYILDSQLNKVALGAVGELYIGGEVGLARGYLDQPDLTSERFIPDPFNTDDTTSRDSSHKRAGQRMYRTGDLVRWNQSGVMEYIGRVDQQVKIRGFRVELGEIESRLQALSKVEHCVVAVKEAGQQKQLFGYLQSSEPDRFDLDEILEALSRELPDYMVPNQLMLLDKLPLTPAGKVDRASLPAMDENIQSIATVVLPKTEQEALLVDIWQQLLGIDQVSCADNFFALGGDSILCLQMVSKVRVSGYNLTPQQVFEGKTLTDLAEALDIHKAATERVLTEEVFGLMPIQAHFFAQEFPEPDHWNQHICVELKQDMNTDYLELAIQALVKQHPSLRLAFKQHQGRWKQQYQPYQERQYLWISSVSSEDAFSAFAQEIHQSMDIDTGRLIQAGYAQCSESPNRLMIAIHHLAVDGVSWRILLDDLWKAYQQQVAGQAIQLMPNSSEIDETVRQVEQWSATEQGKLMQYTWHKLVQKSSNSVKSNQELPPALYHDKQVYKTELSNDFTQTLLRVSNTHHGDIQSVLIAALVSALTSEVQPEVPLYLEGHGREASVFSSVDLSRMVGWTTSLYPMIGYFQPDILGVLNQTHDYLENVKKDGGIGYGVRYLNNETNDSYRASATFNYLGQYSSDGFAHWCTPIEDESLPQSGLNQMLTPLVVNSQVVSGQLSLSWEFSKTHYSLTDIERIAEQYVERLTALVNAMKQGSKVAKSNQCIANLRLVDKLNNTACENEPVFCIHPVTGRVTGYQRLAQALEGDRTVFGIKSQSFVSESVFDSSFNDMADTYYQTIKQIQPHGPYRLVGWSLGGALAQEISLHLEKNGDDIAFVGLLDCYVPGTEIAEDQWDSPTSKTKLMEHISLLLGSITEAQGQRCLELLDSVPPPRWSEVFNTWLAENNFDHYMADNAKQMLYSWAVEQHMRALCRGYQLPSVKTQLHCWWAGQPNGRSELLSKGLNKHNNLQYSVVIDTDHLGIVQNNQVIKDLYRHLYCE